MNANGRFEVTADGRWIDHANDGMTDEQIAARRARATEAFKRMAHQIAAAPMSQRVAVARALNAAREAGSR